MVDEPAADGVYSAQYLNGDAADAAAAEQTKTTEKAEKTAEKTAATAALAEVPVAGISSYGTFEAADAASAGVAADGNNGIGSGARPSLARVQSPQALAASLRAKQWSGQAPTPGW